jgi:energy-coupling factor transporter ATP-binding protein EcfA2
MTAFKLSLHEKSFLPHLSCGVELSLAQGKLNLLRGENGIGKSTLLQALLRKYGEDHRMLLAAQAPLDFFFDRSVATFKEIITQSSSTLDLTLFQEFWNASDLARKNDRFLSRLSGGESQLLKLISICSIEGEIFLLDEPGQYLDPHKKLLVRDLLDRLIQKNKTVLMVEHGTEWFGVAEKQFRLYVENDSLKAKEV